MRSACVAAWCFLLAACTGSADSGTTTTELIVASSTTLISSTTAATTTTIAPPTSASPEICETETCLDPRDPLPRYESRYETLPLAAGTYTTTGFAVPMTFEVGADGDWKTRGEDEDVLVLVSWVEQGIPFPYYGAFLYFIVDAGLNEIIGDEFVKAFRESHCTGDMSGPFDVEIAGFSGVMVETQIDHLGMCHFFDETALGAEFPLPGGPGGDWVRLIDLDVDGQRLLIQLRANYPSKLKELVEKADLLFAAMTIGG